MYGLYDAKNVNGKCRDGLHVKIDDTTQRDYIYPQN
jgi:hypothetical protein